MSFLHSCAKRALSSSFLHLTLHNRMAELRDLIILWWRRLKQCVMLLVYLQTYGSLHLRLQCISITANCSTMLNGELLLSYGVMGKSRVSLILEYLVVLLMSSSRKSIDPNWSRKVYP